MNKLLTMGLTLGLLFTCFPPANAAKLDNNGNHFGALISELDKYKQDIITNGNHTLEENNFDFRLTNENVELKFNPSEKVYVMTITNFDYKVPSYYIYGITNADWLINAKEDRENNILTVKFSKDFSVFFTNWMTLELEQILLPNDLKSTFSDVEVKSLGNNRYEISVKNVSEHVDVEDMQFIADVYGKNPYGESWINGKKTGKNIKFTFVRYE
jgi:hypothetical protein